MAGGDAGGAYRPAVSPIRPRTAETHAKHMKELADCPTRVLLIGDSHIERYGNQRADYMYKALYDELGMAFLGVGGDGISRMLWRARKAAQAAGSRVRLLVVFAGTVDKMQGDPPSKLARGTMQVLEELLKGSSGQPDALVISLTPQYAEEVGGRGKKEKDPDLPRSRTRALCRVTLEANHLLSDLCSNPGAAFPLCRRLAGEGRLRFNDKLHAAVSDGTAAALPKKELLQDHVHLNNDGYRCFDRAILPDVLAALGRRARNLPPAERRTYDAVMRAPTGGSASRDRRDRRRSSAPSPPRRHRRVSPAAAGGKDGGGWRTPSPRWNTPAVDTPAIERVPFPPKRPKRPKRGASPAEPVGGAQRRKRRKGSRSSDGASRTPRSSSSGRSSDSRESAVWGRAGSASVRGASGSGSGSESEASNRGRSDDGQSEEIQRPHEGPSYGSSAEESAEEKPQARAAALAPARAPAAELDQKNVQAQHTKLLQAKMRQKSQRADDNKRAEEVQRTKQQAADALRELVDAVQRAQLQQPRGEIPERHPAAAVPSLPPAGAAVGPACPALIGGVGGVSGVGGVGGVGAVSLPPTPIYDIRKSTEAAFNLLINSFTQSNLQFNGGQAPYTAIPQPQNAIACGGAGIGLYANPQVAAAAAAAVPFPQWSLSEMEEDNIFIKGLPFMSRVWDIHTALLNAGIEVPFWYSAGLWTPQALMLRSHNKKMHDETRAARKATNGIFRVRRPRVPGQPGLIDVAKGALRAYFKAPVMVEYGEDPNFQWRSGTPIDAVHIRMYYDRQDRGRDAVGGCLGLVQVLELSKARMGGVIGLGPPLGLTGAVCMVATPSRHSTVPDIGVEEFTIQFRTPEHAVQCRQALHEQILECYLFCADAASRDKGGARGIYNDRSGYAGALTVNGTPKTRMELEAWVRQNVRT